MKFITDANSSGFSLKDILAGFAAMVVVFVLLAITGPLGGGMPLVI